MQPVELARKLAKEMDEHRSVSVSRVYAPNEYSIYLAPADREQFASYEGSLIGELQEYLAEHARREGYALLTPPRVTVHGDPDLAIGEFGIATQMVEPDPSGQGAPTPPPLARVEVPSLPVPVADTPSTTTIYRPEIPLRGAARNPSRSRPSRCRSTGVGSPSRDRARSSAGRRSARSDWRTATSPGVTASWSRTGDDWSVVDLGSTNGTELNGTVVDRAALTDGDRITVGGTDLVFELTVA